MAKCISGADKNEFISKCEGEGEGEGGKCEIYFIAFRRKCQVWIRVQAGEQESQLTLTKYKTLLLILFAIPRRKHQIIPRNLGPRFIVVYY